jgi:NADH dehydrogenase (ubiquinone) 1 alpha subcomplex subunit 8
MSEGDTPVPVSSVLLAVSRQIASTCAAQNRAFLDCKRRDKNPETCLKQGDEVTSCVIGLCALALQPAL